MLREVVDRCDLQLPRSLHGGFSIPAEYLPDLAAVLDAVGVPRPHTKRMLEVVAKHGNWEAGAGMAGALPASPEPTVIFRPNAPDRRLRGKPNRRSRAPTVVLDVTPQNQAAAQDVGDRVAQALGGPAPRREVPTQLPAVQPPPAPSYARPPAFVPCPVCGGYRDWVVSCVACGRTGQVPPELAAYVEPCGMCVGTGLTMYGGGGCIGCGGGPYQSGSGRVAAREWARVAERVGFRY